MTTAGHTAGWSIRRRLAVAYSVVALVTGITVVLSVVFLIRLDQAVNRRGSLLQPAEIRNQQLIVALLDQETGIRGYALSGDRANLIPYRQGLLAEQQIVPMLRALVTAYPRFEAEVNAVAAAAVQWRADYATPVMKAVDAGGPAAAARVGNLAGKPEFDAIRNADGQLDGQLVKAIKPSRQQVGTAFEVLAGIIGGAVLLLILAVFVLYSATRRWVVVPLDRLRRDVRMVSAGDLNHVVATPLGPPDVRELASDVDTMRLRLADQIAVVEAGRVEVAAAVTRAVAQADNLARSNRDLEQFAYVASHDLQEPLRKVASFCQLLERRYAGSLDERGEQYIAFAVDGAKRMQQLISDLLAFSRVGRSTERFEDLDLAVAANRAAASLPSIAEVGATIDIGELPRVRGDQGLLTQLFQNLLGNAVKFRGDAPPVVTVRSEVIDGLVQITVADNGIGIGAEYAEKIFVIFQRLHARDAYEGTGIGLALCRRIIEFHGGQIWLDTETAQPGTTFKFTLHPAGTEVHPTVFAGMVSA